MAAMRSTGVFAALLAAAVSGCAGTQLFSRAANDDDDRPLTTQSHRDALDARPMSDEKLLDPHGVDAGGRWNVVQDTVEADSNVAINPARPANMDLPISEHLGRAEQALADQRLPEARQHLDAIVLQQPAHPRAHHLLAVIADLEGRWGDAEHHYHTALQSDRNNAAIIGDLGYSYMLQGRLPLAEQYLVQAHALDPTEVNAARNLALLYSRRGDIAVAQRTLADALPPAEAARTLVQMFPGVPIDALGAAPPQMAMSPASVAQPAMPAMNGNIGANSAPSYQSAMVVPPAGTQTPPQAHAMGSFVPDAYSAASNGQYGQFEGAPVAPTGISPTSASRSEYMPPPVVTAHAERPWPPAVWPPVAATAGQSTPTPQQSAAAPSGPSKSGVVYLMQRRPAPGSAAPGVSPNSPPANPAAVPNGPLPSHDPFAPVPSPGPSDREVQYSNGPGSSRIVTWSNLNGQSVAVPPLPPTDKQLQSAATPGMSAGPTQQYPIAQRSSPGTASGLNGGMYPPPQRVLPADRPTIYDYPPQGAPLRTTDPSTMATAPQSGLPLIQSAPPHAGFEIAPAAALPENPLAGYEAERRKYDQQFQQQVNQTYGRSPAGYIQSPTAQMSAPIYEVPTYQSPAYRSATGPGVPLTPNGTPWPGGRETATMNAGSPPSAATPPPYRPATAPATPSYYRKPAQPWDAAYPGPTISPAP